MPMLAKFLPLPDGKEVTYREAPQRNPIRWQLYFLSEDELHPQTSQFKCKDFFNDIVGWYHGKTGSVYGMSTKDMSLNDYGVFVRLYNLLPGFSHNVEKVVNSLLEAAGLESRLLLVECGKNEVVTLLPRELFNNTFIISKVSHLIRLCNIEATVDSLEQLLKGHPFEEAELTVGNLVLPEKYRVYWWYTDESYNSLKNLFDMHWLHNNGYRSWKFATKGEVE